MIPATARAGRAALRFGQLTQPPVPLSALDKDVRTNPYRFALVWTALLAAGSSLSACSRPESGRPQGAAATAAQSSPVASVPKTGGAKDGSLPDTAAALAAAGSAPAATTGPSSAMSREQESKAMPMPGQVNDHSTPATAKAKGN